MGTTTRIEASRALEHELGVLRRRIRRKLAINAKMVHPELPAASFSMLSTLRDGGPCRSADLAELFAIDKGAVSRQISRLEELGLVRRTPDPEDGRAHLLVLTDLAEEKLDEVQRKTREWYIARLEDWTDEELAEFARQLGRYNRALD